MNLFHQSNPITITCSKRLTPYLQKEVIDLGFEVQQIFPANLEIRGTLNDCIRLNLHLRSASKVLYSLKKFYAEDPDQVYKILRSLPWENIIPNDGYFAVTSAVMHPTVNNSLFMNLKVKDAIVDRIRGTTGKRPDSGSELNESVVHLFWNEQGAEIFLDTSGETLAKHAYRKMPGKAPMLESLAAATILATKWDQRSPFINPMCGSGTLAIEAALIATHRKPGLLRYNYAFMHLIGYDPSVYVQERRLIEKQIIQVPDLVIHASDISAEAVRTSQINAEAAEVNDLIDFSVGDFESTPIPESAGVIYFNPEYGERLGKINALETSYARIGDFMKKKCKGYYGYIFTGNLDLAKKVGLKASRRYEFYNSKIDCRLLEYELYEGTKRNFGSHALT